MLKDEIEKAKRSVITDTVQATIGEIATMYTSSELNILPEFQRLFRWSGERKSNFVESILIGIPIPPVFVFENPDGTWELIDGLQRISTILEFMGVLRDPDSDNFRRSKLLDTKYLPSLAGVVWNKETDEETGLDKSLQLFFRRHRVDFQILKHPSDPKTKFDLFQRLNRGGAYANEQEVRTCSMVLANPAFTKRLRLFSDQEEFQKLFRITSDQKLKQDGLEYAVRLVVHTYEDFSKGTDVQEFLDQAILRVIDGHSEEEVMERLGWTIDILWRLLGADALIPPEERAAGIAARFSLRALEGIVVGLARNKDSILALPSPETFIREKIGEFWKQPEVSWMSTPGLRGTVRLQRTLPFGAKWFNPNA
ncbi:DUF262 domain-containing protein [Acidisoma cladoniae]|jgi:hypothetical protein|uniref:DUF262 domain-containing protein n=1 Tax=Acidisoma cladoniae TaxID=3040935 RepID=UPI00254BEB00|nr:DUF262 domain-containing protein [Acidisoma sp. PAMC 29798]